MGRQFDISTYSSNNNEPVVCNSLSVRLRYAPWKESLPAINFAPILLLASMRRPVQMVAMTGVPHITARHTSWSG